MKEKVEAYLIKAGFEKLPVQIPGFTICFTIENGFINAIALADLDVQPDLTKEQFDKVTKQTDWRVVHGEHVEVIDVHMLSVIFGKDVEKARRIAAHDTFCWFVDTDKAKLIVDEDKCGDFYGMRGKISGYLAGPYPETEEVPEEARSKEPDNMDTKVSRSDIRSFFIWKTLKKYAVGNICLIAINVILFLACIFFGNYIYAAGVMDPVGFLGGKQYYRLVTCMFLHADVYHLFGNMINLYLMGEIAEKEMGHLKYLLLYFGSGFVGTAVSLFVSCLAHDFTPSLGASGAVFGVTGALLWMLIRNHGRLEMLTIPKILFLIAYSLYSGFIGTNIDNAAHIGGLIGGFLLAILLYRRKKKKGESAR